MAEVVYVLCAITSIVCAVLLFRGYRANRTSLLFWSSLCFMGLALNNVLLFVDLVMVPSVDMRLWRGAFSLTAVLVLVFGLIME